MLKISELWDQICNHPDFAGGAVFTRQDVAQACFKPDGAWVDPPTPEEVASISDEMLHRSRTTIDSFIFRESYTWLEALRDNVDFSSLASSKS